MKDLITFCYINLNSYTVYHLNNFMEENNINYNNIRL